MLSVLLLAATALATSGVVQFDIQGHHNGLTKDGRLVRRDTNTAEITLDNSFNYYYTVNMSIGTPGQDVVAHIDTGSSDLWVIASSNPYCAQTSSQRRLAAQGLEYVDCDLTGTFDGNKSSSFNLNNTEFQIQYYDGSFAKGQWATDDISFGGTKLKSASFGLGEYANASIVFGIGLPALETSNNAIEGGYTYSNVPLRMKEEGLISANAYSLWLNDLDSKQGSLLFGGVDHSKYTGTLQTLPIVPDAGYSSLGQRDRFNILLTGISVSTSTNGSDSQQVYDGALSVTLDSGATFSHLPSSIAYALGHALDGEYISTLEMYAQRCDAEGSITFSFNGVDISIPFSEYLTPLVNSNGNEPATFTDGSDACAIGVQFATEGYSLGDNFLRNAYVVYNLDRLELSLAPVNFNGGDPKIETIGADGVPSATQAPGYSQTSATRGSVVSGLTLSLTYTGDESSSTDESSLSLTDSFATSLTRGGRLTAESSDTDISSSASGLNSRSASATRSGSSSGSGASASASSTARSGDSTASTSPNVLAPIAFVLALFLSLSALMI